MRAVWWEFLGHGAIKAMSGVPVTRGAWRPTAVTTLAIASVVGSCLLYVLGRLDNGTAARDAAAIAGARAALAVGKPNRARDAQQAARESSAVAAARSERGRRRALEQDLAAAAQDTVGVVPPLPTVRLLTAQGHALTACAAEADSLWSALEICQERGDSARARTAVLEEHLAQVLAVKQCRILLVPCPSRFSVFVGGVIGGVLAAVRLRK